MTTALWIALGVGVGAVVGVVGVCMVVALRDVRHITRVIPQTEGKPEPLLPGGLSSGFWFTDWFGR